MSADRRIPSLDGLRAISIALVLVSHVSGTAGFPIAVLKTGELGVRVFFVISGYLITTLLLAEDKRYGDVSLARFYLRRTFRIFPTYYAYLLLILGLSLGGVIALNDHDAVHAFTYTTNYHLDRSWWMGHTWSLAVEEQFYLLWPFLVVMLGPRRAIWGAAAFVVLSPAIRLADWYGLPSLRELSGESFWTVGDSIAIGCVLAGVRPKLEASTRWHAIQQSPLFAIVPVIVAVSFYIGIEKVLPSLAVLQSIEILGIAMCIDWSIRWHQGAVGKVLNWRPLVWVGTLSYSLYLWQQPFLNRHSTAWFSAFPVNLGLALAVALASFYLIEQPMLRVREKLEARWLGKRTPVAPPAA
ncbi:MAG: acyltransferase [Deltaproteobacteria bacterium]|nr:acyltransferase [Deltaproteobacteria bacterium]